MTSTLSIALILITAALVSAGGVAFWSGRWRAVFAPFRINSRKMTVERLGLVVQDTGGIERVDSILSSFLSGFNATLTARTWADAVGVCDSMPVLLQPFAHEGLAMGYTPRALMRYDAASFERDVVRPRPEYRYLYYVGLGFWSGMRNHSPIHIARIVEGLDSLHRYLVFDGYGFKVAFFDAPKSDKALSRLNAFSGYGRHAAWQGVGRALYFRFMDDADALIKHIEACGDYAVDAAAGVGLASVFVNPDRIDRALSLAEKLPESWRPHVHLGTCFGLKARSINNVDRFQQDLSDMSVETRLAVESSIRECDRIELLIRADGGDNGYQRWRERVTAWMDQNVAYPLQGLRTGANVVVKSGANDGKSKQSSRVEVKKGVAL